MSEKVSLTPQQACPRDMPATGATRTTRDRTPSTPILPRPPRPAARRRALQILIDTYDGDTYRLLTDLADSLYTSIAYVDRPTVEAHLDRTLSDREWAAAAQQFSAMDFDDHVGDVGSLRTDWIEDVLTRAGVPGRRHTAAGQPVAASRQGGA